MKPLRLLPFLFFLTACGGDALLSDNEKSAMNKVTEFYGGSCGWSKGFEYENGTNEDYFELKMSGSELLRQYADMIEMPASNCAYLFYTNLGEDQKKYTHIRVGINLGEEGGFEKSFPTKDLKEIKQLTPYLPLIEKLAISEDYETIWATFDPEIQATMTKDTLRDFFQMNDSLCGPFGQIQFQGYRFYKSEEDEREMVHLACVVIREKENTRLSMYFDRKTRKLMGLSENF